MRKFFFALTLFFAAWAVCVPALAQTNVIISEFLASNNSAAGLKDEDGNLEDWIEIQNAGTSAVNLQDWSLTDEIGSPTKWRFPATNIDAGAFIVVFASENDRRTPGAPLHANFRLAAGGEYLALIRPDGTIATEFNEYPAQVPNVSYGRGVLTTNTTLISTASLARVIIPTAATPTNWANLDFD